MIKKKKRIFAIYLPQFHPIPENDAFWGKGFTEWHNVASALPQFSGHHQPHLPTELGFYDLRVPETLQQQSKLAGEYGIDGFMFYHYWFNRPVMEKPLEIYLRLKENKLPYYFCWANENWTRRWDGGETDVLLKQDYNENDNREHFAYLSQFFNDPKYVKVNDCPVLAIYRPTHIPNLEKWVENFRKTAVELGFKGIYLMYVLTHGRDSDTDVYEKRFDSGLLFEPGWGDTTPGGITVNVMDKVGKLLYLMKLRKKPPILYRHSMIDYEQYVSGRIRNYRPKNFKCFPSVFPNWDNSPRRKKGGGHIFINANPKTFKKWLEDSVIRFTPYSDEENFILINAWNEWAEGNHLEPCNQWGRQYLEAVKEVVDNHITSHVDESALLERM
jgi:hypothetical protein